MGRVVGRDLDPTSGVAAGLDLQPARLVVPDGQANAAVGLRQAGQLESVDPLAIFAEDQPVRVKSGAVQPQWAMVIRAQPSVLRREMIDAGFDPFALAQFDLPGTSMHRLYR